VASLSQGRTAAAQCGLFTHKSVPVIFEPPCITTVLCVIYTATCFNNFLSSSGSLCTALLVGRSRDRFPVVSLGIFSVVPPKEPCALRSTQPQKVSTRDFSWGKGSRCVWLTTYHPCSAETSRKSVVLTYPEPLGPPRPVPGDLHFYFIREFITNALLSYYKLLK